MLAYFIAGQSASAGDSALSSAPLADQQVGLAVAVQVGAGNAEAQAVLPSVA